MGKKLNIVTGQTFNKLTIIKEIEPHIYPSGRPRRRYLCKCECGNQTKVLINHLKKNTKSCGCWKIENGSILGNSELARHYGKDNKSYKHGDAGIKLEYYIWKNMKQRCNNPNNKKYKDYGGRGIKVCVEWEKSYKQFIKDMGPKPTPIHSIDRINNNGNYEPSNCKWSTPKEQANNKRNNIRI